MQVTFPDGTTVLARGRLDVVSPDRPRNPDFAIYLDDRWSGDPQVTWPRRMIDWEDFGLPANETELFEAVVDLHRRARVGELVEIGCYGGVGRTGTTLACLGVLADLSPREAVEWVRSNYHASAIETPEQEELVTRFADAQGAP